MRNAIASLVTATALLYPSMSEGAQTANNIEETKKALNAAIGKLDPVTHVKARAALSGDQTLLADGEMSENDKGIIHSHAQLLKTMAGMEEAALRILKLIGDDTAKSLVPVVIPGNNTPAIGANTAMPTKKSSTPDKPRKHNEFDFSVSENFVPHPMFAQQAQGSVRPTDDGNGIVAKMKDAMDINAGRTRSIPVAPRSNRVKVKFKSEVKLDRGSKGTITPMNIVFIDAAGRTEARPIDNNEMVNLPKGVTELCFEFIIARQRPSGTATVSDLEVEFK